MRDGLKSASCQRLRRDALVWLDVPGSMLPLLPIIKTALNRLQPPPKPAVPYPTAPPPRSQTLSFCRQNTALSFLLSILLVLFFFFPPPEVQVCVFLVLLQYIWCSGWRSDRNEKEQIKTEAGALNNRWKPKMDLLIFLFLHLFCFDPSAGKSLITGKLYN